MKRLLLFGSILVCLPLFAQQSLIPLHTFYKDQLLANKKNSPYNAGSFYPACEDDYDLIKAINDSTPQYYDFTHVLFQKYLFEIRGKDYYLKISPAIEFAYGKDIADTNDRTLFQNTRGLHVEGNLFNNFAFSTSLYENQGRYTQYESDYYRAHGELYPSVGTGTYFSQNAVIPGGARTKDFKGDGFDYAYAVGYFVYKPFKFLRVSAGNNQQFIGDGYRSLLLSDNSYSAPYFKIDWKISSKFAFTYYRARHMNLLRRPLTGSVEAYYEAKGYSVNYFTYKPTNSISVSLFESGEWNRGDSIVSKSSHPLYYNPVPFVSGLALKNKNEVASLLGLNISAQISKNNRIYGQVAMNDYDIKKTAVQLGIRSYRLFGLEDFMVQAEYNYVAPDTYKSSNPRLNAVHYNLPIAHPKGDGFHEAIIRANYEVRRVYVDIAMIQYWLINHSDVDLLPVYRDFPKYNDNLFYSNVELGYRFNRKMNLCLYAAWTYRQTTTDINPTTNAFYVGLRTGFINHYKDI